MFKKCISFSFVLIVFILMGCGSQGWNSNDQNAIIKRCKAEGGSRKYCNCYLENAMKKYNSAEELDQISFEEAVELSLNCYE